ncbi:MAG: glycosyltransferase family 39 protein [Gaiellaceae bacterium]
MNSFGDSMIEAAEAPGDRALPARPQSRSGDWRAAAPRVVLLVLLLLAFAIRLDGISAPPFDNGVARQFHAALVARIYYLESSTGLTPQQQSILATLEDDVELIEPPIMELLAAGAYHLAGREVLWAPRTLSALWWVLGVFLLYLIAGRLMRPVAALVACAVYLFLPFAVLTSRSFQPDPLLVAAILAAVLTIVRYDERPSRERLAAATAVSATALLIKPGIAVSFVFAVFLALSLRRIGVRGAILNGRFAAFCLCVVPMFAWYVYGTVVQTFLGGHFGDKVSPSLLGDWEFWNSWWREITYVLTYPLGQETITVFVLVASAAGLLVAPPGRPRTLLGALWAGYALFGLIFTVHISSHNYYSLPLVPIVALSLGSLCDAVLARVRLTEWLAAIVVGVGGALVAVTVVAKLHPVSTNPEFSAKAARYTAIGRAADHTPRALYVDMHYGDPASYYGWTSGRLLASGWENDPEGLSRQGLAAALVDPSPRSCLIFTGGPLRGRLASFESDVATRFAVRRRTAEFAIYDLSRSAGSRSDGC